MPAPKKLKVGKSLKLHANVLPANTTRNGLIWHLSDPNELTINKFGEVTAHKVGKSTIQVYSWADAKPLADKKSPEFLKSGCF